MKADLDPLTADRPERMTISRMTLADIRAVMRIEALSFSTTWPATICGEALKPAACPACPYNVSYTM